VFVRTSTAWRTKDAGGELLTDAGARTGVPEHLRLDVIDSARECPGACIHVVRADGVEVAARHRPRTAAGR